MKPDPCFLSELHSLRKSEPLQYQPFYIYGMFSCLCHWIYKLFSSCMTIDSFVPELSSGVKTELTLKQHKPHEEHQYLELIRRILKDGSIEQTRNGHTICTFGNCMKFSLRDGQIPLLTSKRIAWRTCFTELMWFIRGETKNQWLQERNVHIWDGNSTREFLDNRNLHHYPTGTLGPIYGWQWRFWNAPYNDSSVIHTPDMKSGGHRTQNDDGGAKLQSNTFPLHEKRQDQTIDQLQQVLNDLKNPLCRSSRRLLVSAWNPSQIDEMALPPCHVLFQFHVREGKYLSCALYQRSGDVGLGIPFNIASYSFLTHLVANHCGLEAEEFIMFLGNTHIYEEHINALQKQLKNEYNLYDFPRLCINQVKENIEDYTIDDIEWIVPYQCHDTIPIPFIA